MEQDGFTLRRRIRAGHLDAHPTDLAIVVHYEVEAGVVGDDGGDVIAESKQHQKVINVPSLSKKSNVTAIASAIIEKCKYIHPSMQPELEQLLKYLQTRGRVTVKKGHADDKRSLLQLGAQPEDKRVSLNELDDYLELLYGEDADKAEGTSKILQLARYPDNLGDLARNETLLNALTRVMRDNVSNIQININIISIFFFFSSYRDFHEMLAFYKVGSTCMKIIEQEIVRHREWQARVEKYEKRVAKGKASNEELAAYLKKLDDKQFQQDTLLFVVFHLLLNLAEDPVVESKMCNKNLVPQLVCMLGRHNIEFVSLILKFLHKLSVFEENKEEMLSLGVIDKIMPLLPHVNMHLQDAALALLYNLSFDQAARHQMLQQGAVLKLSEILQDPVEGTPVERVIYILYHLSIDRGHRRAFAESDAVPLVMQLLLAETNQPAPLDALALGVNLALDKSCAERICQGDGLELLLQQAIHTRDALMFKMIRNVTQHDETKAQLLPLLDTLASEITTCKEEDIIVELLGTLTNVDLPNMNFTGFDEQYGLVSLTHTLMNRPDVGDDLLLECVAVVATLLIDADVAPRVADVGIVEDMVRLIQDKQDDDELVLQIVFVWAKLLHYDSTRRKIMAQNQAIGFLTDLMFDNNERIRRVVASALDIVMEHSDRWADVIRSRRFQFHNAQWSEMFLDEKAVGEGIAEADFAGDHYGVQRERMQSPDRQARDDLVSYSNADIGYSHMLQNAEHLAYDDDLVEFNESDESEPYGDDDIGFD